MAQAHLIISGIVQGVYFRAHTRDMAQSFGLKGWVRNLPDGRVEAVFTGDKESIQQAIDWCSHGPSSARVDKVEVKWVVSPPARGEESGQEFNGFNIQ